MVNDIERKIKFSLLIEPCIIQNIYCNDKKVNYSLSPGAGKIKIEFNADASIGHQISIWYRPLVIKLTGPELFYSNTTVQWQTNTDIDYISDPQRILKSYKILKNKIQVVINNNSVGFHQLFFRIKNMPLICPVDLDIKPFYSIHCRSAVYDATKHKIFLEVHSSSPSFS